MSMRHHWQELDELLAQLDREARFKRGPFRPGMKPLSGPGATPEATTAEVATEPDSAIVIPLRPVKPPEAP